MAFSSPILKSPLIKVNRRKISSSSFRPVNDTASISSTLEETNKILVEIQQQIGIAFGMRNAEEKEKNENLKEERSRERLRLREGALESVKKIGTVVKGAADTILQPVKGIFEKIMDFLKVLGTGFAVNAVFDWLKDENNIKKVEGWFSWIKDNWKWMAAAVGAIALLPVISTISGILGPVGLIVGLLAKAVPLLLAVLTNPIFLGVAAGAGLLLGGKAIADAIRRNRAGGEAHLNAFDALKEELSEEIPGIKIKGSGKGETFGFGNLKGRFAKSFSSTATEEQKALLESYKKRRDALIDNKNAMQAEISKQRDAVNPVMKERKTNQQERMRGGGATRTVEDRQATEKLRNEAESKVRAQFEGNIQGIIEARRMGGPVVAGRPYLVGEGGPEMFTPAFNGNIINNMKTEKIYEMISSKNAGKINFVSMELPPKFMNSGKNTSTEEQQEIPIPTISAVNGSNPYMSITPNVYGIYV